MSFPQGWLVPQWPVPARVRATCTVRTGGASGKPYDSLNLGAHVGDDPGAVAANRAAVTKALGASPVFLEQVHGNAVVRIDAATPHATRADGCLTTESGVACTIMVADCLPILLADAKGTAVAAAHAGWRGLAGEGGAGIVENTVRLLREAAGGRELVAWLGPCIGPAAFEVGDEVKQAFERYDPAAASMFTPGPAGGKWMANLQGLARQRLAALGVLHIHGNDGSAPWCTVSNPSVFFSHRRDRTSGRFAACVWLD
ncbi:MAG: peptidoglycan editing factor PgeF [Burkholderiaceae bacterium]